VTAPDIRSGTEPDMRSGTQPPLVDLARRAARFEPELSTALARVLASGVLLLGPELDAVERELAEHAGRKHAIGVASGTDALRLSLVALGVGPGAEVIVPAFTAVPTAAAVCAAGATPVFADVDRDTAALDSVAAERAVTERTRALIPVHLYGRPATVPDLGVPVLEDAAQALGALDARSGSAAVACSFYPTKNLGGITDGGAVLTDDDDLAAELRLLRVHGARTGSVPERQTGSVPERQTGSVPERQTGYEHTRIATNSRLSELAAAALRIGLRRLDDDNRRRREIVARYRAAAPHVRWHEPHERHVYHLCVARVANRDEFRAGVPFGTGVHYPRALTQQPAYARFVRAPCPSAEAWAAECVSLPCFPEMSDDEIEAVCRSLP
jgi:dTDP-4-amino-4,6-dideoxygalactose transaminase